MSFDACAQIVEKGDPARFRAAMAAPLPARRVLFPLYAFNVEVARAPWVTAEPMIAEMRLQWWRDVLGEIAGGGPVRRHEVATPLAEVLDTAGAQALDALVAARRWDIYKDPFEDEAHFSDYLRDTSGVLMAEAGRALSSADCASLQTLGTATGLTRFLSAVPALEAQGRVPLIDGRPAAIAALARTALETLHGIKPTGPASLEAWETAPLLRQIAKKPARVANGTIGLSPFRSRVRLLRWAMRG